MCAGQITTSFLCRTDVNATALIWKQLLISNKAEQSSKVLGWKHTHGQPENILPPAL